MNSGAAENRATYLYCLTDSECLPIANELVEQCGPGVDSRYPVSYIDTDGLVAIISAVHPEEFNDQNLASIEWLAPRAYRHEAVIETIQATSPVLPVKFGTVFHDEYRLMEYVASRRTDIADLLRWLSDKSEWNVKGFLHEAMAREHVLNASATLAAMRASLPQSPGLRYLREKQFDTLIEAEMLSMSEESIAVIVADLSACAVETLAIRLLPASMTTQEGRMLLNQAFLLEKAAIPRFKSVFTVLETDCVQEGLRLVLDGPRAAFHFCDPVPLYP